MAGEGSGPALNISISTCNTCSLRSKERGWASPVTRVHKEKREPPPSHSFQLPQQYGKNKLIDNEAVEDSLLVEQITEQSSDWGAWDPLCACLSRQKGKVDHLWVKASSNQCCLCALLAPAGMPPVHQKQHHSISHWHGTLFHPRTVFAELREVACIVVAVRELRKGIKLSLAFAVLWQQNICSELFLLLSVPIHRLCDSSRDHCGHRGSKNVVLTRT